MDDLNRKYIDDKLTPEELKELRERVNALSDEEIGDAISKDWDKFMDSQSRDMNESLMRMKVDIDRRINECHRSSRPAWTRVVSIAATILLPLFVFATVYLYLNGNYSGVAPRQSHVVTAEGERAKVMLPDGSEVCLNSNSDIGYYADYVDGKRLVEFAGEAYFNVSKDADHPFHITVHDLQIMVKGTSFNLLARPDDGFTEVALESGSVELKSGKKSDTVSLTPGHVALVDRSTGDISVTKDDDIAARSAWLRHELIFVNATPDELVSRLEDAYGIRVSSDVKNALTDTFTGTLPSDDLDEAYAILSRIFGFDRM